MSFRLKIGILITLLLFSSSIFIVVSCEFQFYSLNMCQPHIYFLDVGQGDSILFSIYDDFFRRVTLLIDVGSFDSNLSEQIGYALPPFDFFFDKEIDYLIITHTDEDHYGYLSQLKKKYDIGMELYPCEGESFLLSGIKFYTLNPICQDQRMIPVGNDQSVVLRVESENLSVLLTGDISSKVENRLISDYGDFLDINILKVGHHGSKYSTGLFFLEKVSPKISVVSVEKDNSYGHPDKRVLDDLEYINSVILMTKDLGTISFPISTLPF